MSFVTTACGGALGGGSPTPPDPCPHSGAATSPATATAADHSTQCIIPTSVESRRLFPCTQREPDIHVPARSRLIIAPIRRVDNHRRDVEAVPQVVQAHEGTQPQGAHRPIPAEAHVGRPPGARGGVERVVDHVARRVSLLDLYPGPARERRPRLQQEVEPVLRNAGERAAVEDACPDGIARIAKVGVGPGGRQIQSGQNLELRAQLDTTVAGLPGVLEVHPAGGGRRRIRVSDQLDIFSFLDLTTTWTYSDFRYTSYS